MYYRYVVYLGRHGCSNGEEQGLLTLVPFMEDQSLTKNERKQLNEAKNVFTGLPYPFNADGEDVYAKYRGKRLKAWFTNAGENKFHDACAILCGLANKYLVEFEYSVAKQLRQRKLKNGHSIVYADDFQVVEGWIDDDAPTVMPNARV